MNLPTIDTSERLIHGSLLKCVDGRWSAQDNPDLTGKTLLALTTTRAIQRWQSKEPVETLVDSGTGLPDVNALNTTIPRVEWEPGLDGLPRPPWQLQFVVYLLDPADASIYTFANSTVGARIAWERLVDRVSWMRALKGADVFPVVLLDSKPMKTKMGVVKQRPEFTIIEWRDLSCGPTVAQQQQRTIEAKPAKPAPVGGPVQEPTTTETLDDEIPF